MTQTSHPHFGLFDTEERSLHCDSMGQDFQVGVWLPFSYGSSDRTHPVLTGSG